MHDYRREAFNLFSEGGDADALTGNVGDQGKSEG